MKTIILRTTPQYKTRTTFTNDGVRLDNNPYRLKQPGEDIPVKTVTTNVVPGKMLFVHTAIDNTVAKTVNEALKQGVNLDHIDLTNLDLSFETIQGLGKDVSQMQYADFTGSNLIGALIQDVQLFKASFVDVEGYVAVFKNLYANATNWSNSNFTAAIFDDVLAYHAFAVNADFTGTIGKLGGRGHMKQKCKVGKNGGGHEYKGTLYDTPAPVWPTREEAKQAKIERNAAILQHLKSICYPGLIPVVG
jgi:hypothetical protein